MNWWLIAIAGTMSGILGAMGLGGGGVLIIYLTLFTDLDQTTAQGINLLFFIPTAIIAVIIYLRKKLISLKLAIPSILFGFIGAFLGTYLSSLIDNNWLSRIFGILLLIMGLIQLFSKNKSDTNNCNI